MRGSRKYFGGRGRGQGKFKFGGGGGSEAYLR